MSKNTFFLCTGGGFTCLVLDSQVQGFARDKPLPLQNFILPENHRLVSHVCESQEDGQDGSSEDAGKSQLAQFCRAKDLQISACTLTPAMQASRWVVSLPHREQNGLAAHAQVQPDMKSIDLGPSIFRMNPVTHLETFHTLVPNSRIIYDHPECGWRLFTGAERMMLTGFSRQLLEAAGKMNFSEALFKDLSGNAFSGSCPLACFLSILAHVPQEHIRRFFTVAASVGEPAKSDTGGSTTDLGTGVSCDGSGNHGFERVEDIVGVW